MALSANTVWEVRGTNGSDTNGGGWVPGSSGTDFSQQNSSQYSVTDGVANGTTTITSATANFGTDVVGNVMYVQGGTGSITAGWYQITARTNSTTITVDRSTGLSSGTGVTLKIGGALQTITTAATLVVGGNFISVKAESTYIQTASASFGAACRIFGYSSIRGDSGRANIQLSTNSSLIALTCTSAFDVANFDIDCNSLSVSSGINVPNGSMKANNCIVRNATNLGIASGSSVNIVTNCQAYNCAWGIKLGDTGGHTAYSVVANCFIKGGSVGIQNYGIIGSCVNCIISGASTYGYYPADGTGHTIVNNTFYNCALGCVTMGLNYIKNNIFSNCTTGLGVGPGSPIGAREEFDGNIYYSCGTNRSSIDITTGVYASLPYINTKDIVLTQPPLVDPANDDYTLNSLVGGGEKCKSTGAGPPISSLNIGYLDFGALQFGKKTGVIKNYRSRDRRSKVI